MVYRPGVFVDGFYNSAYDWWYDLVGLWRYIFGTPDFFGCWNGDTDMLMPGDAEPTLEVALGPGGVDPSVQNGILRKNIGIHTVYHDRKVRGNSKKKSNGFCIKYSIHWTPGLQTATQLFHEGHSWWFTTYELASWLDLPLAVFFSSHVKPPANLWGRDPAVSNTQRWPGVKMGQGQRQDLVRSQMVQLLGEYLVDFMEHHGTSQSKMDDD